LRSSARNGAPSAVKPVAVLSQQDRAGRSLADGNVDRPSGPGDQRDHGRLAALSHDPQRAVAPLECEVLDVRRAGLADAQPVETEEHGEGGVGVVEALGGEEEGAEL
jgi:hypothetical protein